jgi:hypothetical protein
VLAFSLLLAAASAQDTADVICPDDRRTAFVQAAVGVEQAWLGLDGPGFEVHRNRLGRFVACVDVPLTAADALLLHRARALVAFVDGDTEGARRAFAAIHALEPSWTPPAEIPPDHPLRALWQDAVDDDEDPKILRFRAAPTHGWALDGTRFPRPGDPQDVIDTYGLPDDRAFVLQLFDEHEAVSYTGYHFSPADVPVRELSVVDHDATRPRRRAARIAGASLGGALLAGGAVAFAFGWQDRAAVAGGDVPLTDVLHRQARGNALGGAAYALAGAGALALTLGVAVPW